MPQTLTAARSISLADLWASEPPAAQTIPFNPADCDGLPPLARRYLTWAIAPGTPLATAVRLHMHGTLKLGDRWHRFTGEEVIRWQRGMVWRATTWMQGLPILGADRWVDGHGEMRWKLLGLLPMIQASGEDVARSGAGRIQGEAVWLPSAFCHTAIAWTELNATQVQADFTAFGEPAQLTLTLDEQGAIQRVALRRWGNPAGGDYRYNTFGVIATASGTFDGYTIPTQIRAGWYFGTDRFESEGEFFRCTIDRARYR